MRQYDEHSDKSNVADRRHAYCSFACTRHDDFLSDFNMVDQLMDNPFLSASHGIGSGGVRRGWDAEEIEDSLLLRLDMPGLGFRGRMKSTSCFRLDCRKLIKVIGEESQGTM